MLKKRYKGLTGRRTSHASDVSRKEMIKPSLSQRTVSVMIQLYEFLCSSDRPFRVLGPLLDTNVLHDGLFAMGITKPFLDRCQWTYFWNFRSLFPALSDGTFFEGWPEGGGVKNYPLGQDYLRAFAVFLSGLFRYRPDLSVAFEQKRALESTLEADGYRFDGSHLLETRKSTINEPREVTLVEKLIRDSAHDRIDILLHHFQNGQKLFEEGKYHPCTGEWRSFLEEMLRGIWRLTRQCRQEFVKYSATPSMTDLFLYLKKSAFFDGDEEQAFRSSYGFLSAGGHPGISEKDEAYLAQILALTFGHALLLKLGSWAAGGYAHFT